MNDPIYDGSYLVTDPDGQLRRKRPENDLLCDFCCEKIVGACWTYPCGEMPLPLAGDPTGLPAFSDDPWCCCLTCKPLVDAKDWRGLAERSMKVQMAPPGWEAGGTIFEGDFMDGLYAPIIAHFERFDAARNGEPYETA